MSNLKISLIVGSKGLNRGDTSKHLLGFEDPGYREWAKKTARLNLNKKHRVMLTGALGALVKEPKRETFALKISHFTLLKNWLHKFQDNFTILFFLLLTLLYLASLTGAQGHYLAFSLIKLDIYLEK
jgi:hypothetical protein